MAIPATLFVVVAVALIAWFAAKVTQRNEELGQVQQELSIQKHTVDEAQARVATLDGQLATLQSAGRTTVVLSSAKDKKAFATATWGEQPNGKTWLRMNAYGFAQPTDNKIYRVWFQPLEGAPVDAGKIAPDRDGNAFAQIKDLPAVDQGKGLIVSLDAPEAAVPSQPLVQASLPTLTPEIMAPVAPATPAQ